ncbi:MAG: ABC transporter ATP-binding protein [Aestuariivita sp.]|nr:ABC transporter ATP-binding protein [Aestuariivita sp.]MCY4202793.1 ABC transporter ATP-binding protein [Aestuariivita sp.]
MRFWKSKANAADRKPLFSVADRENLAWFWHSYFKQKTPFLVVVMIMILIQGIVYQQFIALTEDGLRVIFEEGAVSQLVNVCLVVLIIFSVRAVFSYLVPRISAWLASDAVMRMRRDLIDHIMMMDLAYFERTRSGEIILRLVNQAQDLSQFIGQTTVSAVRDFVTIVIVSGYLTWKSPLLFALAVIMLPTVGFMVRFVSEQIKIVQASAEDAMGNYMTGLEEMSNGMRTVKISNQEPVERRRLVKATDELKDISIRLQAVQAMMTPSVDIVAALVYILIIGGGGYMALSANFDMDAAAVVAFMIGMALVFDPARRLTTFFVRMQASLIILDSVRSIYRITPEIVNVPDAVTTFNAQGDIVFDNVCFKYPDGQQLFTGVNTRFKGGKITAIVGPNGSGKTTMLSLMARLYNLESGQITIGGQRIDQLRIDVLRQSFSVVAQDIVIFNSSIWENVRYVRPQASEEEIWAVIEHVGMTELVHERGDAPLGPKGAQLSGGQKQRIAIARAFLRDAPILILDEATSALDQRTEEEVQVVINELARSKTTIVVAHRLSTVTHADKIYVLDSGNLLDEGTHDELMARGGYYQKMYLSQKKSYGR